MPGAGLTIKDEKLRLVGGALIEDSNFPYLLTCVPIYLISL